MALQLDKDWRVYADELNFTLQKRTNKKMEDGSIGTTWSNKYYFSTLGQACSFYLSQRLSKALNTQSAQGIKDVIGYTDEAVSNIMTMFNRLDATLKDIRTAQDKMVDLPEEEDWGFLED